MILAWNNRISKPTTVASGTQNGVGNAAVSARCATEPTTGSIFRSSNPESPKNMPGQNMPGQTQRHPGKPITQLRKGDTLY
jgi:hypothetical protein